MWMPIAKEMKLENTKYYTDKISNYGLLDPHPVQ